MRKPLITLWINIFSMYKVIRRTFGVLILFLFLNGCQNNGRSEILYLFSKDKSQVVTVISNYRENVRIIVPGKHSGNSWSSIKKIELNISEITELGDEIGICWSFEGYKWKIVNDNAKLISNNLNPEEYLFEESWPKNDDDIPTPKSYWQTNCYTVGTLPHSQPKPKENGIVERQ